MDNPETIMITLEGLLEQIVYHNEKTGYTVARLKAGAGNRPVTVVGCMAGAAAGQAIKLSGQWTTHPRYGQQFKFSSVDVTLPATIDGIRKYLLSGIVKGIGPATAKKIIASFGEETIQVLDKAPERLCEVDGIGETKAESIADQWRSHRSVSEIMNLLQQYGLKAAYGAKIYRTYGDQAMEVIKNEPYRLAEDIGGMGFFIADSLARQMGLAPDEPERAEACIEHLLDQAASAGHVYMLHDDLVGKMCKHFEIDSEASIQAISDLFQDGRIIVENPPLDSGKAVFGKELYRAEQVIANRLSALLSVPSEPMSMGTDELLAEIENRFLLRFSDMQRNALESVLTCRAAVITGGPGTGKTTLIRTIAAAFQRLGHRVCLAAPTGRAARRLSEVTLKPAHTIHKLLGFNFEEQSFEKDTDNPIDADVLIVDEASMIDTTLMSHLIGAVRLNSRLILVGDMFQLPPVGPGNILADIIASDTVPVCRLNEIFRQAGKSPIVINAHKVRKGEMPELVPFSPETPQHSEFYFLTAENPVQIADAITKLCEKTLPDAFDFTPVSDIQVVTPIHKGEVGTIELNRRLQAALNPDAPSMNGSHQQFRTGDRVMHLKNNYHKEVFNGDIGIVTSIDPTCGELYVDFYGRSVSYTADDMDELSLGYAISVHKSQGSEYPAIIMPLTTQHYVMLQRNLLYTAITRARQLVILVGTEKALSVALKNDKPQHRLTGLTGRLRACCGETVYAFE